MRNVLVSFAQYIQDSGFGTIGANIFTESFPSSPVKAIAVLPAGGAVISPAIDMISVMIQVRDKSSDDADNLSSQIWILMNDAWNILTAIPGHVETGSLPNLMRDANNFPIYTFNAEIKTTAFKKGGLYG